MFTSPTSQILAENDEVGKALTDSPEVLPQRERRGRARGRENLATP